MKSTLVKTIAAFLAGSSSSVYAATTGATGEGSGILIWFLIGFAVLLVMLQGIPALIMFGSMLKGLFSAPAHTEQPKARR